MCLWAGFWQAAEAFPVMTLLWLCWLMDASAQPKEA